MDLTTRELKTIRSALRHLWLDASESAEDMELLAKVEAEIERREAALEEMRIRF
jgi:hypothetical protein